MTARAEQEASSEPLQDRPPDPTFRPATRVAVGLAALAAAASLSGCGAGQISQMATQEPAVNGNRVTINNVALRDIRIQAVQTGDFLQPGRTVNLVAVAVNQSPDVADRLVGITSDIGPVTVTGDGRCRPAASCSSARPTARTWRRAPGLQQRRQGDRRPGQAHLERPHLQLHFHFREGRAGQRDGPDFGRTGTRTGLAGRPVPPGLSHRPDTVTAWQTHAPNTAARNANTSRPSGWAAAWSAARGAPSTRFRRSRRSVAPAVGTRLREPSRSVPSNPMSAGTARRA